MPEAGQDLSDHYFGGEHTREKLAVLAKYLPAYTTALSKQPFRLNYIDAFAGTGLCRIKAPGGELLIPGSARIALECVPPFHRLVFIEAKRRHADALGRLKAANAHRDITITWGDANSELPKAFARLDRATDRVVTFIDPYGLALDWATLAGLKDFITDIWYLFPLSGLYRQAATDAASLDEHKIAAIDRLLGTHDWYDALYGSAPQTDLFGGVAADVRMADVNAITTFVSERLGKTFPGGVARPKILYQTRAGGAIGAPLFALYFIITNRSPKARAVALNIARDILKAP